MSAQTPAQPAPPTEKKETDYVFNHNWSLVVKAFWDKYPNKDMDFVKFNKLVKLHLDDEGNLHLTRVQYSCKWKWFWAYVQEDIVIDSNNKVMTMQSRVLKKGDMVPVLGNEFITYKAIQDLKEKVETTVYSKKLVLEGTINKALGAFNDGFTKGIKIVEKNCEQLQNMTTEEWVRRFTPRV